MVLLVLVVVRVVVGVAHCLAAAACVGVLGAEVGRMKRQEGEEYDKPLLLHVLVLLLANAPQSRPLVEEGGRRPIIIVVNVCKPGVRPPPAAAAAAATTRVAHCKSRQQ